MLNLKDVLDDNGKFTGDYLFKNKHKNYYQVLIPASETK